MTAHGTIVVEPARATDAGTIARLHGEGIAEGFLSSLGPAFLTRLYRAMTSFTEASVLVARRSDHVVGFVAGAAVPGRFYREFMRRNAFEAALSAAPRLWRPAVVRRAFETLRHVSRSSSAPSAELLAIAVDPSSRRGGIGAELVSHLEEELVAAGGTTISVFVGATNAGARGFYERLGFAHPTSLEVHRGARSVRYTKPLTPRPAA